MLGNLRQGQLTMSEVHKFKNVPVKEDDSFQWNIPQLYQETLEGLRESALSMNPSTASVAIRGLRITCSSRRMVPSSRPLTIIAIPHRS